jgi:hypothetical protein
MAEVSNMRCMELSQTEDILQPSISLHPSASSLSLSLFLSLLSRLLIVFSLSEMANPHTLSLALYQLCPVLLVSLQTLDAWMAERTFPMLAFSDIWRSITCPTWQHVKSLPTWSQGISIDSPHFAAGLLGKQQKAWNFLRRCRHYCHNI